MIFVNFICEEEKSIEFRQMVNLNVKVTFLFQGDNLFHDFKT